MTKNKTFSIILSICLLMTIIPNAFAADDVLPAITKITPADGTTEVPLMDVVMEVHFSTAMDKATVNTKNITMTYDAIAKIEMSGEKKALIYLKKLQRDTEYEIVFSRGVRSNKGDDLTRTSAKFTTTAVYPKYRQLVNSDMEDTSKLYVYSDAGANTISFAKDGNNTVLKSIVAWDEARVQQMVYLEPNASYEMHARIKSNTAQKIRCVLNYTETGSVSWYHYDGEVSIEAGQWYDLAARFQIPSSINPEAYIEIASFKKGSEVYIDDWQFFEVGYDIEAPKMYLGDSEEKTVTMIENTEKDNNYQMLQAMGIYGSKEYNEPKEQVTRENFAKYLAKMLGLGDMKDTVPQGQFSDIDDSYEGYASIAVSQNLMLPDSNGAFNPYGVIEANDALRALIVMSGHQYMLENSLPYAVAGSLGLTKGVNNIASNSKLTYSHLNRMLRNFIEMDMGFVKNYSTVDSYTKENSTVMESVLRINEYRGIVEATNVTSLDKPDGLKSDYVRINGKEYQVIDCDTQDLIGKKVTYYTKERGDEEEIIYFADIDKHNDIISIDALDIDDYSNNTYKYYIGNKMKKAILSTDKYFIYNHRSSGIYTDRNMVPEYGSVELIDNNDDGKIDIVKVFDYQTFVIQSVDRENGIITDKFENKSIKVNVDDTHVYSDGVKVEFKTLSAGNVLTIANSLDGEYAIIYKSSNTIKGVVSAIESENNRNHVVFYDEVHKDEIITKAEYIVDYPGCDKIQISENGIFYLDVFGKIIAFEKIAGEWNFGYFIKAFKDDVFCDNVILKIFTEDNSIEKLESAKKLRIDKSSFKENEALYQELQSLEPQLIQYKLNSLGEITRIITASNGEKDSLREIAKLKDQYYLSDSGSIGNKVYIDKETKLFVVPSVHNSAENYEYKATEASSFMYNTKTYSFTAYSNTEKNSVADVIVMYDRPVQNIDAIGVGVVDNIILTLNEDDEVITQIELKTSSSDRKIRVDRKIDLNNLSAENGDNGLKCEEGDIITWTDRMDGYANDIKIIFKADSKSLKTASNPSTTSFNKAARVFGGAIRNIENTYVRLESDEDYEIYNTMVFKKLLSYDGEFLDEITVSEMFEEQFVVVISAWNGNTLFVVYKN